MTAPIELIAPQAGRRACGPEDASDPRAQQPKMATVGTLVTGNPSPEARVALRPAGLIEGQNVRLDVRSAEGNDTPLPQKAAELVRLKVDVNRRLPEQSAVSTAAPDTRSRARLRASCNEARHRDSRTSPASRRRCENGRGGGSRCRCAILEARFTARRSAKIALGVGASLLLQSLPTARRTLRRRLASVHRCYGSAYPDPPKR
jgi:hypothetical protein